MEDIKIREAGMGDCAALDSLLTELIRYEARYDPVVDPGYAVENNYAERLGIPGHKAFVAEADGEMIGFIYGFAYEIPGMYRGPVAIADALYVAEGYRGKGIGAKLFGEFRKFAAEQNALRIELKAITENAEALRFYEKLGFRETKKYMAL